MIWNAIVPINWGRDCKTRLADQLNRLERDRLVEKMARHVIDQTLSTPNITNITIISPEQPPILGATWIKDEGRGLNPELASALGNTPTIILHADLPYLEISDIQMMLQAAENSGTAIAPDRYGTGTNALALVDPAGFIPQFGVNSFALHKASLPHADIVIRDGLGRDIDTPDDLE